LNRCLALPILAALALATPSPAAAGAGDPVDCVDPRIGTGGHGHTFPGPTLPFGMVQLSPDTRLTGWDGCSGYHDSDRRVFGFSHTHLSGTGVGDYGDILLLPATGRIRWISGYAPADSAHGYGSRFRKTTERASAGYYAVHLDDYDVTAELTATLRAGMHRYTFEQSGPAHILLDLSHRDEVIESSLRVVGPQEIEGFRRSRAWARNQRIYFVARFSRPVDALIAVDDQPREGLAFADGKNVKAAFRFAAKRGEAVLVKVGISAVDVDGARRNLDEEIPGWGFEDAHQAARLAWEEALGRITLRGGTVEQETIFYTALYHALLQPNTYSDRDGRYRGRDDAIHVADGRTQYTVFSLWDTFRAAHPLYTILEPARTTDFIETMLAQRREGGLLPVWELAANETDCMIGYHAVSVIADAYAKGVRGFDAEAALEAMRASADQDARGLAPYRRYGYIPADKESESVSKTLEYAYDDWCIARMAEALGHEAERAKYDRRAGSWRNLLDPGTGFMRPKRNAAWLVPFRPTEVDFNFTEANSWQYTFFVPHDISGEMDALGGPAAYAAKLDSLFAAPPRTTGREQSDITGLIGQYAHGNEPSHHMAYLYAYAGQPWKTQRRVREIMSTMYAARPDGLIGNEDCGQMSAWYVLSALGFYSVCPGRAEYTIGTPLFPAAVLRLPNGRALTVEAVGSGPERPYIQSATLDGAPFERGWITHEEILRGGRLVFQMGAAPNLTWGVGPGKTPVSSMPGPKPPAIPYVAAGETPFRESTQIALASPAADAVIRYTLDGSQPTGASPVYTKPIALTATTTVCFRSDTGDGESAPAQEATFHRIPGSRRVTSLSATHHQYSANGPDALIDGIRGGEDWRLGGWLGFYGTDMEAVVDLGETATLRRLAMSFLQDQNSWIFMPRSVSFEVSTDGVAWESAGAAANDVDERAEGVVLKDFGVSLDSVSARYVRINAAAPGVCPSWHKGAGNLSFIFADEFLVEVEIR
jgi:predicted alpha-1,2-mannosidase